ncbi:MAG TPA: hypothetical protein PLP21_07325 [Pyrinomonadaceae bacterium]|nr:hypothetical protein [Acidobacteriota bacterium]HQZ96115.1 hypothetical protein [Pyrinomonadaceae bacterium]
MKRFAITILTVAVFFVGLGALVDNVGAKFKSDEKALDLVRKARVAIGGDAAINAVQSLRLVGQTTRTVKVDGTDRSEQGETEIALQFPDKLMKSIKIGHGDGNGLVEQRIDKQVDVVVVGEAKEGQKMKIIADGNSGGAVARKIVIRKDDGTVQELTGDEAAKFVTKADHPGMPAGAHTITLKKNADGTIEQVGGGEGQTIILHKADGTGGNATFTSKDGKTFNIDGKDVVMERAIAGGPAGGPRDNELLRTTLSLLLTAPQGMDVSYTFGGESSVDGTDCNIVVAEFAGTSYKIFLGKSSNLPVMMSYSAPKMPMIFARTIAPKAGEEPKGNVMFTRTISGDAGPMAEYTVKFSDYRAVNGVQLPYKWTRSVGGATDEVFDVTNYEINPANISEKFQNNNVKVRMAKPVIDK